MYILMFWPVLEESWKVPDPQTESSDRKNVPFNRQEPWAGLGSNGPKGGEKEEEKETWGRGSYMMQGSPWDFMELSWFVLSGLRGQKSVHNNGV